ncbi:uncharacterized protein LOC110994876 isoform X1 [Pieris rapae]|uniref:uncharacterized protein LOC110994876 isoform X1 n=1 Tax=Pieris rapae TaxID=64459 RepID=UPI001E27E7D7|nr:uncharacterized protein LOC110994876 isoform X1 [Pieris rapae]XP_022117462.2 uncharacterized protein LOC110994876 isoform X1 [Pieris rapae]XP_045484304.1 uncharacterized protein LOC110994876 isoform X1 [Pieris rapae]
MVDEESGCHLRKRRFAGTPNLALNLEVGYQVNEGSSGLGTPSPGYSKAAPTPTSAQLRREFRNKQQSLDIPIEDCEEIEIVIESDEDGDKEEENASAVIKVDRPVTPTPVQDFGASVVYTEGKMHKRSSLDNECYSRTVITKGPQPMDFLNVNAIEHDCYTDVSDADSDEEEN